MSCSRKQPILELLLCAINVSSILSSSTNQRSFWNRKIKVVILLVFGLRRQYLKGMMVRRSRLRLVLVCMKTYHAGKLSGTKIALKSIGYKSLAIDGLPFDNHKGIVPNIGGRVLANVSQDESECDTGLYVCGWLKRGPTGIIGTNLYCAEETLACISDDIYKGVLASDSSRPGGQGLLQLLDSRRIRVVPFSGWERIDAEERRLGNLKGKPRQKLTTWEELLEVGCA